MAQKKPNQNSGSSKSKTAKSAVKKNASPSPANVNKVKKTRAKKKPPEEPKRPALTDFTLPQGVKLEDEISPTVVYHMVEFLKTYNVARNTFKMWCRKRWIGYSPVGGLTFVRQIDFFRMLRYFFKPPFYDLVLLLPFLSDLDVAPLL